jgi:hypothetical protein
MASVIALADWPKQTKTRPVPEHSAEVVIFTGVRFERLRDDPQPMVRAKRVAASHNQATAEELE